jgi:retron-type reverse transcriptase
MYRNQKLRIKWNSHCSDIFPVYNGVKQGGVISPVLFGLYLDELISRLRLSGYGCKVGPHFLGCVAYADDIVVLSPTMVGLKGMLKICQDYAYEFKVQFNGSKSQFIMFDRNVKCRSMSH